MRSSQRAAFLAVLSTHQSSPFARSRRTAMRREGPTDEKEALMATITRGENGLLVDGEPFDPTCMREFK